LTPLPVTHIDVRGDVIVNRMKIGEMKLRIYLLFLLVPLFVGCPDDSGSTDTGTPDAQDVAIDESSDPISDSGDTATEDVATDEGLDVEEADAFEREPSQFPWSAESTDSTCSDGSDNDENGYSDCADFGCSRNIAVTVCGDDAQYEASPDLCDNGGDDDGDGLVDCADPDCGRNPFHDVCEKAFPEPSCGLGTDGDGDGLVDCADTDCLLDGGECDTTTFTRVLFDQTIDETSAGGPNSDWVIDGMGSHPVPSDPTGPNEWNGALSSFGFALWQSGDYLVESLPSWSGRLTYSDQSNAQDLSRYDILVLFEPSRAMTDAEKTAIIQFVLDGGGLLAVANHVGADRDGNGYSAPMVFNDMLTNNDVAADPFGFGFDENDIHTGAPLTRVVGTTHPVIAGAAGTVGRIGFYDGCSAYLTGTNGTAVGLILFDDAASTSEGIAVGAVEAGEGRVVFLTDSAIGGDGTDSHGTVQSDHDSWDNSAQDNRALFLNAMDWLSE